MERGIRLGTIDGISICAGWSLLIILWLLTWSLASAGLPDLASGYTHLEYWIAAVLTAVVFFASLLAHELSHSIVARHSGLQVHDITLWLLGGISRIEQEASTPGDDLRIAIAGPATSIGVAVVMFVVALVAVAVGAPALVAGCAVWLAAINVLLAVFNLVPAAPLDGGRVLRAILWRRTGYRAGAAISATKAGRAFAYLLFVIGFAEFLFAVDVSGLWFVLLGAFVLMMARAEEMQIRVGRDLAGVPVRDVMTPDPLTVPGDLDADEVLHVFVLGRHCSSFPVVDHDGRVLGLVTLRQLRAVPAHLRATTRASDIAVPISRVPQARPDELVLDVLRRTNDSTGDGRILVFKDGVLVGIVSFTDVTRAIQIAELEHSP